MITYCLRAKWPLVKKDTDDAIMWYQESLPAHKNWNKRNTSQGKHRHHLHHIRQRRHYDVANQQHIEARDPTASKRLDTPSRPGQETAIPMESYSRHLSD